MLQVLVNFIQRESSRTILCLNVVTGESDPQLRAWWHFDQPPPSVKPARATSRQHAKPHNPLPTMRCVEEQLIYGDSN